MNKLINRITNRLGPTSMLNILFKAQKPVLSIDNILNPPTNAKIDIKNCYIPLSRTTLVREILQDSRLLLPSERFNFEKIAVMLDHKIKNEFRLLERDLSLTFTNHQTVRNVESNEAKDIEYWLIQRLTDLLPMAGFVEIPSKQLAVSPADRLNKDELFIRIDSEKYDVIRCWVRGFHTFSSSASPDSTTTKHPHNHTGSKTESEPVHISLYSFGKLKETASYVAGYLKEKMRSSDNPLKRFKSVVSRKVRRADAQEEMSCFGQVYTIIRRKNSPHLDLKLYKNVPTTSRFLHNSQFAQSLIYLLPVHHTYPLSEINRLGLRLCVCIGLASVCLLSPLSYLFSFHPDIIVAWSVAALATSLSTTCLIWTRYWRAQTKLALRLKQIQYECCQSTGLQSIDILLKLAHEHKFKSVLLTYALLLRASQNNVSITSSQLNVQAESWIAKRLKPTTHTALLSSTGSLVESHKLPGARFSGGSGPLFDIQFDSEDALSFLKRFDLIKGGANSNDHQLVAVPPNSANLEHYLRDIERLDNLWTSSPLNTEIDLDLRHRTLG